MKTLSMTLVLVGCFYDAALAQQGPLQHYDWTQWLIGEWEGTYERPGVTLPMRQSFAYFLDGRYLYTEVQLGEGPEAFRGFGIFEYFPEADSAFGHFFDSNGITNDGWGKRVGERLVWHIDQHRRGGLTTTRVRERLGADAYVSRNYHVEADGTQVHTIERMRRKKPDAASGS